MAAQHFLALAAGRITRVFALLASAGSGSANAIPALDGNGKLDISFMPAGIGQTTDTVVASEALAAGAAVNLWSNAGTLNVRNADNTAAGKECDGYVVSAVLSGANALVYLPCGKISGLTGLTVGAYYYLGTTGGLVLAASLPTAAGSIIQQIGRADSATTLSFDPQLPITL